MLTQNERFGLSTFIETRLCKLVDCCKRPGGWKGGLYLVPVCEAYPNRRLPPYRTKVYSAPCLSWNRGILLHLRLVIIRDVCRLTLGYLFTRLASLSRASLSRWALVVKLVSTPRVRSLFVCPTCAARSSLAVGL